MKTDVGTLVAVDMDRYFGTRLQLFARGQLVVLHVRPNDVVGLAGGHPLGKLAGVIGIDLPVGLFLVGPPDLHLDPIDRAPVGVPNRSEDKSAGWWRLPGPATLRTRRRQQKRPKKH